MLARLGPPPTVIARRASVVGDRSSIIALCAAVKGERSSVCERECCERGEGEEWGHGAFDAEGEGVVSRRWPRVEEDEIGEEK